MRWGLICCLVFSNAIGLTAQAGSPKAKEDTEAYIRVKARAIAEYRMPLPGSGIKVKDIDDGFWFQGLSETEKAERFRSESCSTAYGSINCKNLKRRLTELYSDRSNLRIPYTEAVYISVQQEKGAAEAAVRLEITVARETMRECATCARLKPVILVS